jgi:Family of unknown function (DUF6345)
MARIGLEYIDSFANARAAGYSDVIDLDSPYYIGEWFIGNLADAGHPTAVVRRNRQVRERDLRDVSLDGEDARAVDSVDLCLVITHGNYSEHRCHLLFDIAEDSWEGHSGDWRLGDTCHLEWLMFFGCHSVDRDHLLDHLHVFRGLHLLCGAYGDMFDSWTIQEAGEDTSNHLLCGKPVADAWLEGVSDWWVENHPIVVSVERQAQYDDGEVDWPQTVLRSDHLWGHGTTRADVAPSQQYFMACIWSDRGVWDLW